MSDTDARMARGCFLVILLCILLGALRPLRADDSSSSAKALALRAHAKAAAIDSLPRCLIQVDARTLDDVVLEDASDDPLENLKRALDEPSDETDWYCYRPIFAWDEEHFLIGSGRLDAVNHAEADATPVYLNSGSYNWGTRTLSGQRYKRADKPAEHVLRENAVATWKDTSFTGPKYLSVTPHKFWWGESSEADHQLSSGVPPSLSDYRSLGAEEFDGETCRVIESPTRMIRIWISQETGFIRGYLHLTAPGQYAGFRGSKFHESQIAEEIAGRAFATARDYLTWKLTDFKQLPIEKKWALTKAWTETVDWSRTLPTTLIRFREFREISPGIHWPFKEDLAFGSLRKKGFECVRGKCVVREIRTDLDLTAAVEALQPKEGERVQDQRYAISVNYDYDADRTEAAILKMVDTRMQERMEDQELIARLKEPFEKLMGQPAPPLPEEGWIGGNRPDVVGQPYLVGFWATWCGPCKNDFSDLRELAEGGACIVGMHPLGTPAKDVEKVLDECNLGYPTYLPPENDAGDGRLRIAGYPVAMFPYYVLVDPQGNVAGHGSLNERHGELPGKLREYRDSLAENDNP